MNLTHIAIGGYYAGWFLMDVYQIVDIDSFADSVQRLISVESTTEMPTGGALHHAMSPTITLIVVAYSLYSLL